MSRRTDTDPRQGNAGSLAKWLANPKNRAKMYAHDREAAKDLAESDNTPDRWNRQQKPKE